MFQSTFSSVYMVGQTIGPCFNLHFLLSIWLVKQLDHVCKLMTPVCDDAGRYYIYHNVQFFEMK